MIGKKKIRLGELLLQKKVITQDQLEKALSVQQSEKKKLGEVLTEMGFVTEEQIMRVLSQQLEIPSINLTLVAVPDDIVALVNPQILRKHVMIPFEYAEGKANTMQGRITAEYAVGYALDPNALRKRLNQGDLN